MVASHSRWLYWASVFSLPPLAAAPSSVAVVLADEVSIWLVVNYRVVSH